MSREMGVGILVGAALGLALDNFTLGITIGMIFGFGTEDGGNQA